MENFDLANIGIWAAALIAVASAVQTVIPSVSDNPIFNFVTKALNMLALNFGAARNLDDPK